MNNGEIAREMRRSRERSFADASAAAAAGLGDRAAAAGLLDVSYGEVDSPLGVLLVAATRKGLVRLAYPDEERDRVLEGLAAEVSPRLLESSARLDVVRRGLEAYFEGRTRELELEVDYALTKGFVRRVLRATARIPFGELSTYRVVARRAGSPNAYRAAGNALGSNPIPIVVPCHRVIHSTGGLGGYTGGLERKEFLLKLEGALS
ncbi:MAG: methylated-DNA--[protein]-cysteine S-methyltransferase [Actinomycetota bacterium]|nr:methylated-DNA--[protein]-cysteine S-methyltransferase [Actinomycetota bacterium]